MLRFSWPVVYDLPAAVWRAGGGLAGRRAVIDNVFLNNGIFFLSAGDSSAFSHLLIERFTADSHFHTYLHFSSIFIFLFTFKSFFLSSLGSSLGFILVTGELDSCRAWGEV